MCAATQVYTSLALTRAGLCLVRALRIHAIGGVNEAARTALAEGVTA